MMRYETVTNPKIQLEAKIMAKITSKTELGRDVTSQRKTGPRIAEFGLFVPGKLWTINTERAESRYRRADRTRRWRATSALVIRSKGIEHSARVGISIRPIQPRGKLCDAANHFPVAKAVVDGFVDARFIDDDSPKYVSEIRLLAPIRGEIEGVEVTIWGDNETI